MSNYAYHIIPNTRPLCIAEAMIDEDDAFEGISFLPIVAWKVAVEIDPDSDQNYAIPVTLDELPSMFAVYDAESKVWNHWATTGEGLYELELRFRSILEQRRKNQKQDTHD